MLYLFYGPDSYSSRQQVYDTIATLASPDMAGLDIVRLDGTQCRWRDVVDACAVLPFLSQHQIVVLKGFIAAASQRKKKAGSDDDTGIAEPASAGSSTDLERRYPTPQQWSGFLGQVPETTHLLLWEEDELPATNAFLKAVQALSPSSVRVTHSIPLVGQQLTLWLQHYAGQRQVQLDGSLARQLIQAHGSDLWAQANELDKLCAAVGPGGMITPQIVDDLMTVAVEATVYTFADALFGGRVAHAFDLARALQEQGVAPEYILAVLNGRLRDSVTGGGAAKGTGPARFAPKPVLPFDRLVDAYDKLVTADRILKTASTEERAGIPDFLVVELAVMHR